MNYSDSKGKLSLEFLSTLFIRKTLKLDDSRRCYQLLYADLRIMFHGQASTLLPIRS